MLLSGHHDATTVLYVFTARSWGQESIIMRQTMVAFPGWLHCHCLPTGSLTTLCTFTSPPPPPSISQSSLYILYIVWVSKPEIESTKYSCLSVKYWSPVRGIKPGFVITDHLLLRLTEDQLISLKGTQLAIVNYVIHSLQYYVKLY